MGELGPSTRGFFARLLADADERSEGVVEVVLMEARLAIALDVLSRA